MAIVLHAKIFLGADARYQMKMLFSLGKLLSIIAVKFSPLEFPLSHCEHVPLNRCARPFVPIPSHLVKKSQNLLLRLNFPHSLVNGLRWTIEYLMLLLTRVVFFFAIS